MDKTNNNLVKFYSYSLVLMKLVQGMIHFVIVKKGNFLMRKYEEENRCEINVCRAMMFILIALFLYVYGVGVVAFDYCVGRHCIKKTYQVDIRSTEILVMIFYMISYPSIILITMLENKELYNLPIKYNDPKWHEDPGHQTYHQLEIEDLKDKLEPWHLVAALSVFLIVLQIAVLMFISYIISVYKEINEQESSNQVPLADINPFTDDQALIEPEDDEQWDDDTLPEYGEPVIVEDETSEKEIVKPVFAAPNDAFVYPSVKV